MDAAAAPRDWLRGTLDPCLLALVEASGSTYGYELANHLAASGIGTITGGSLYPALTRLERDGLLRSHWKAGESGPGRKYYEVTVDGRRRLELLRTQWRSFSAAVTGVLEGALR